MEIEKTSAELEVERQAEFDKLAAVEANPEGAVPEHKPEEATPKEEALPESGKKEETPAPKEGEAPSAGEPKTEKSEQGAKSEDEGIAKALKDTKAWATKLAMEKATLEKEVESLKAGGASKEKVDEAKAAAGETRKVLDEKIKKVSEDYPELKEVLDLLASTTDKALSKAENFDRITEAQSKQAEARSKFEKDIEPKILEVHSDFRKVAFSEEYLGWVKTQSPAIQYAAMESLDPRDINMTLTEFKKHQASGDAEKMKTDEDKRKQGLKDNLSMVRGGGSVSKTGGRPTKLEDIDPNDREAAFEFLAAQEAAKKR